MDQTILIVLFLLLGLIPFFVVVYPVWAMRRKHRYSPLVENRLRLPGESTRAKSIDIITDILGQYFGMYFVILIAATSILYRDIGILSKFVVLFLGLAALGYFSYRINKNMRKAFNYRIGAEGEEYTGQELNLLARDGAYVFHDVPYKYGNIDHVVVGHEKIFVVETKAVRKPADSDGKKEAVVHYDGKNLHFPHCKIDAPLEQAKRHADHLSKLLSNGGDFSIPVVPVVALPGWFVKSGNCSGAVVQVINPKRGSFLRKQIGARKECDEFTLAVQKIESLARDDSPLAKITDPDAADHFNLWTNERKA